MTVEARIAIAAEKLRRANVNPETVYLTKADAAQLQYELIRQGGEVAHTIMMHGINKAVPKILGLKIVWRSSSFQVA